MTGAGDRHVRLLLQENTGEQQDGVGFSKPKWTDKARLWAAIKTLSGRERFYAEQAGGAATHEVTLAYSATTKKITPGSHRLLWGERPLNIEAIDDPDQRHHEIILRCQETVK